MKKWFKIILIVALIVGALKLLYFLMPDKHINGLYLIPSDAMYILETDDPIESWKSLSSSGVWKVLKTHAIFKEIGEDADFLDELMLENKILFGLFGKRKFYMSAHMTSKNDYDFLFSVDLDKSAKAVILYNALEKALPKGDYVVTRRLYNDIEMLEITDKSKDKLTLCKVSNYLLSSYTPSLIEKAIDQKADPYFGLDAHFESVFKRVSNNGIGRAYVQWDYLDEYLGCYGVDKETIKGLNMSLGFSGLDLNFTNTSWKLVGSTSVVDSSNSYLRALLKSGSSEHHLPEFISNRTAYYLTFNCSSMKNFYEELQEVMKEDKDSYDKFQNYRKKTENLLAIDIEKHLLSWMGTEAGIIQLEPDNSYASSEDLVVCIKANDMEYAQKRLKEVTTQIKKRTPGTFKSIYYKNYHIQYLAIKGIFKHFFGSAFEKLDKPYFTYLGDYVLFSNSPKTLIGCIEDFEKNSVLSDTENFKSMELESGKRSMNIFIAPSRTLNVLATKVSNSAKSSLQQSRKQIDAFGSFFFSLSSKGDQLKTEVLLQLRTDKDDNPISKGEISALYEKFVVDEADMAVDSIFVLQYIEDGYFKRFYQGTDKLEVKAEMKGAKKHGDYEEYYLDGVLRVSGNYKQDKRNGVWKFFNPDGSLQDKQRY
jgi:hypothetical protein